jgi:hypothetical protein
MAEIPEWKTALRDFRTIGWIGFLVLVIAIGIASIFFGSNDDYGPPKVPVSHAAK